MPNITRWSRHVPAHEAIAAREQRAELVAELRRAMYDRGVATAKWNAHRAACDHCRPLQPGCGLPRHCRAGAAKLARLRSAYARAKAAREALAPRPATQAELF